MRIFFIETSSIRSSQGKRKAFVIAGSREMAIDSFCEKFNLDVHDVNRCSPISDEEDILFEEQLL